ncbi:MAG: DUF1275 domain-containing protein [Taibaiella sp.]|nr:DUF1275 domain-containing protein [Taibaiella sp.]
MAFHAVPFELYIEMLRHVGEKRSFRNNLRIAVLLCLNAGFINAAGFIAFKVLTTNVTGHAALLAVSVASSDFRIVQMAALWLLLFLLGALSTGMVISKVGREKSAAYYIPILVILCIALSVAVFGHNYSRSIGQTELFAGGLLFAMGMQNALVSVISGSIVRTTHLTGMFTDLGLDLSLLCAPGKTDQAAKKRVLLRLTIISFFLLGGIIGGVLFLRFSFHAFYIPVFILLTALFYDYFRMNIIRVIRHERGE